MACGQLGVGPKLRRGCSADGEFGGGDVLEPSEPAWILNPVRTFGRICVATVNSAAMLSLALSRTYRDGNGDTDAHGLVGWLLDELGLALLLGGPSSSAFRLVEGVGAGLPLGALRFRAWR